MSLAFSMMLHGAVLVKKLQSPFMVQLKGVINTMMDKLGQFAKETAYFKKSELNVLLLTRLRALAAEVTLGGQAHVPDMEGVWLGLVRNGQSNVFLSYRSNYGLLQLSSYVGTVNSMVDQLSAFAFEVTRVALEVGTQKMASNLADQVLSISEVAFVNVDVQEEILDLKTTVNSMAAQLGTLANEVSPSSQFVLIDNVNLMAMNLTTQSQK
ncbi:hypothetical protein BYT27DRAFT_7212860 [Phlegmacium glaucopus]|nr:hypothetical protein BYT27DRAFT_7212860 [Phlegmacium glaucopus]